MREWKMRHDHKSGGAENSGVELRGKPLVFKLSRMLAPSHLCNILLLFRCIIIALY